LNLDAFENDYFEEVDAMNNVVCENGYADEVDAMNNAAFEYDNAGGLDSLNESISSVYTVADVMDSSLEDFGLDLPFREVIRLELVKFCLYLCTMDDMEADRRARVFNDCLEFEIDKDAFMPALMHYKVVSDIVGTDYLSEVPVSLKLISLVDKKANTKGCKILLDAYKQLGASLLASNFARGGNIGVYSDQVRATLEGYRNYISMLEKFIETECGYLVVG